jgi:hypothetical protein
MCIENNDASRRKASLIRESTNDRAHCRRFAGTGGTDDGAVPCHKDVRVNNGGDALSTGKVTYCNAAWGSRLTIHTSQVFLSEEVNFVSHCRQLGDTTTEISKAFAFADQLHADPSMPKGLLCG